jgi:putative ABC transport system permease protein
MIKFLLKGIINDRSRSLLPIIVVSIGATLTVLMYCWMKGFLNDSIVMNANFNTGHIKVMTRAYAKDAEQIPNDLAIIGVDTLLKGLKVENPDVDWVKRIRFGGLIDFPDANGETRVQGPVVGWAIDLLSPGSKEKERFNLDKSIIEGRIPTKSGESLITSDFAKKFKVKPGDKFTLFGTTMDGSMAFKNLTVAGTVQFGSSVLDRGAIIIDITDAQLALSMEDAAGEVMGYFENNQYDNEKATTISNAFNAKFKTNRDEFAPIMLRLKDQGGMSDFLDYTNVVGSFMVLIFVLAMSVVLWNAGLLGGLRRYSEFGLRIALGEEKGHIYKTLIYEGLLIGMLGSIIGTTIGLGFAFYLQIVGFNMSGMMKNSSLMMSPIARAMVTPTAFYIGFIPGLLSMVLGNALSGIGIYKRNTTQLIKELEV